MAGSRPRLDRGGRRGPRRRRSLPRRTQSKSPRTTSTAQERARDEHAKKERGRTEEGRRARQEHGEHGERAGTATTRAGWRCRYTERPAHPAPDSSSRPRGRRRPARARREGGRLHLTSGSASRSARASASRTTSRPVALIAPLLIGPFQGSQPTDKASVSTTATPETRGDLPLPPRQVRAGRDARGDHRPPGRRVRARGARAAGRSPAPSWSPARSSASTSPRRRCWRAASTSPSSSARRHRRRG